MAAPTYNLNAAKNGTRLRRLTVGELPAQLAYLKRQARAYRRALEQAVVDAHGEVSVVNAHHVDTAVSAMLHAGVCQWLLRERIDTMSAADILACSREMLRARESRDRAVKQLGLIVQPNVLDVLYGPGEPVSCGFGEADQTDGHLRNNAPGGR